MDIPTISAALASINLASQFIKSSIDKIKDNAVREKVEELLNSIIPLQIHIITFYEKYSTCAKEKENLEQKRRENEDWKQEASRYKLIELASGVYAYAKEKLMDDSEPHHYICAKCYSDRKKTILQRDSISHDGIHYKYDRCGSEIIDHSKAPDLQDFAE